MNIFDINNIFFLLGDYPVSYVEFIGTVTGLLSVYFAARSNLLTWPVGIINELFFFALFFQLQLYADMFLQIFFFVVTVFGWYNWRRKSGELKISKCSGKNQNTIILCLALGTVAFGLLFTFIHVWLPDLFKQPAAYPFADSFIMVGSVAATWLLAKKKIETWILWILVDVVAVSIYWLKSAKILSCEYLIFLIIACFGFYNWRKLMKL